MGADEGDEDVGEDEEDEEGEGEGEGEDVSVVDIPFELVGEVASAGTVAETGHIKSIAAARHDG